jgi:hypothetical protein
VERAEGAAIGGVVKDIAGDVAAFGVFIGLAALAIWVGVGIATLAADCWSPGWPGARRGLLRS